MKRVKTIERQAFQDFGNHLKLILTSYFLFLLFFYGITHFKNIDILQNTFGNVPLDLKPKNAKILSYIIPSVELCTACLLIFQRTYRTGVKAVFLILALFTLYISWILFIMPSPPCSCGGLMYFMNWEQQFVFNLLSLFFVAALLQLSKKY